MTSIPNRLRLVRTSPVWLQAGPAPDEWLALASRSGGDIVTDHRSSFVRQRRIGGVSVFVKVYEYMTWGDRLRGLGRWTGPFAATRAEREFDALVWLRQHGFEAPEPLAVAVERRLGLVVRALLVTATHPGQRADVALGQLDASERISLAAAIHAFLDTLHAHGFRDGNFDLRNLLVARAGDRWRIAKLDSPRHRIVAAAGRDDRRARADRARLRAQIATFLAVSPGASDCPERPPRAGT